MRLCVLPKILTCLLIIAASLLSIFAAEQNYDKIIIGADNDYYPYLGVFKKQKGGIIIDMIKEIFAISNHKVEIRWSIFSNGLGKAISGKNDAFAFCYKTAFRKKILFWPDLPWGTITINTYNLKNDKPSLNDPEKANKIGLTKNFFYPKQFILDRNYNIIWSRTSQITIKRFFAKRFDYIAINPVILEFYTRKFNITQQYQKVEKMLGPKKIFISFAKTPRGKHFKEIFNNNYKIYIESGKRKKLLKKWQKKLNLKKPILNEIK